MSYLKWIAKYIYSLKKSIQIYGIKQLNKYKNKSTINIKFWMYLSVISSVGSVQGFSSLFSFYSVLLKNFHFYSVSIQFSRKFLISIQFLFSSLGKCSVSIQFLFSFYSVSIQFLFSFYSVNFRKTIYFFNKQKWKNIK